MSKYVSEAVSSKFTRSDKHAVAASDFAYPPEYRGPTPVREAVYAIAAKLSISPVATLEFFDRFSSGLIMPRLAEGLFVFPSVDALAARHFPSIVNQAERYSRSVEMLFMEGLACNYREEKIDPDRLRQESRTLDMLSRLQTTQQGDILIVPAQFGILYVGESAHRVGESFEVNEFGLGTFQVGCMAFTNPSRFVSWGHLQVDCAGDRLAESDGVFSDCPYLGFFHDQLIFGTRDSGYPLERFGSVTAFLPK